MSMSTLSSLIKKESLHIIRDPRTMLINIFMPLTLLILFGFAISNEVNTVRIACLVAEHTDATHNIIERFRVNRYFDFKGIISPAEIDPMMKRGEIDAAVVMRPDRGTLKCQIVVDASNTTIAQSSVIYIRSVLTGDTHKLPFVTRTLYNPELKSSYNFVPGIMGMIFIMICAIMTSVSIVSEKETGTMDLLLVSPIKPHTIIIGKLVPYFVLSCIILSVMLVMAYTVLGLPPTAQIVHVIWITLLYVVLSLSIGLLVSAIVDNQVAALMVSAVVFMVPIVMFSGMLFPIDNMPLPLQWLSCIIPARWYINAIRMLMIQELPLSYVIKDVLILTAMTAVLLSVAVQKFRSNS